VLSLLAGAGRIPAPVSFPALTAADAGAGGDVHGTPPACVCVCACGRAAGPVRSHVNLSYPPVLS